MEKITVRAADGASVQMTAQGAHVCSWIPAGGQEQLFLSKTSEWREGVAIRGGVPVIFPQFGGLGNLPKHGFARTTQWKLESCSNDAQGKGIAVFVLQDNEASRAVWPYAFTAQLRVTVYADQLNIALDIRNTGTDTFSFTAALHTYFAVQDIAAARLHGLQHCQYRDSMNGGQLSTETADSLHITAETDRIYLNTPSELRLQQPQQVMQIRSEGFADTVVWNPGATGAVKLSDLEPEGHQRMLCVEAAAIGQPVILAAGQSWCGQQQLRVLPAADQN
ncbi:D-hexose-6-phosphate mutarotase [Undibacterium squillarum]|uniref:D-hexose-6-phosphate mutarotase n=1 Tax=Undibacterium squillarum TaxID=1131567 RepID=UPI0035B15DF8